MQSKINYHCDKIQNTKLKLLNFSMKRPSFYYLKVLNLRNLQNLINLKHSAANFDSSNRSYPNSERVTVKAFHINKVLSTKINKGKSNSTLLKLVYFPLYLLAYLFICKMVFINITNSVPLK